MVDKKAKRFCLHLEHYLFAWSFGISFLLVQISKHDQNIKFGNLIKCLLLSLALVCQKICMSCITEFTNITMIINAYDSGNKQFRVAG